MHRPSTMFPISIGLFVYRSSPVSTDIYRLVSGGAGKVLEDGLKAW